MATVKVYALTFNDPQSEEGSFDTYGGVFPTREAAAEFASRCNYIVTEGDQWPEKPVPFASIYETVLEGVATL